MIDRVVTSGTFTIDGESFDVDNNVWLVGDTDEVLVVDAAHDHEPILAGIAGRRVTAIVATHGHNDHINAAGALADATGAPILLHPDDRPLWDQVHGDREPDGDLADGARPLRRRLPPPGAAHPRAHARWRVPARSVEPGSSSAPTPCSRVGPGRRAGASATSRRSSRASAPSSSCSLRRPVVHTGHGDSTTIGAEAPHLDEWIARGH